MKRLLPLLLIILLFSCKKDKQNNKTELYQFKLTKGLYGTYLPKDYLAALTTTKSHTLSQSASKAVATSLTITPEKILFDYNYHEGLYLPYTIKNNTEILVGEGDNDKSLEIQEDGTIIDNNGFCFLKVSDETVNVTEDLRRVICTEIFKDNFYKNKDHYVYCKQGQVIIDGNPYEIRLDTVFDSKEYDHLYNKENNYYFEIKNDTIVLFKAVYPEGVDPNKYIDAIDVASYQKLMELKKEITKK